jgi:transcriptional regulator with XRE-family HTH domain
MERWLAMSKAIDTFDAAVGKAIERRRSEVGITQQALASEVALTGLSWNRSTVGKVERGSRSLDVAEVLAITVALEVSLAELLSFDEMVNVGEGRWTTQFVQAALIGAAGDLQVDEAYWSPALEREQGQLADAIKNLNPVFEMVNAHHKRFRLRWDLEAAPYGAWKRLLERAGKLEEDAAKRLALSTRLEVNSADIVAAVDLLKWGSLEDERDRRALEDPKSAGATPRVLGVLRGHAMRAMDLELIDQIEAAADRAAAKVAKGNQQ